MNKYENEGNKRKKAIMKNNSILGYMNKYANKANKKKVMPEMLDIGDIWLHTLTISLVVFVLQQEPLHALSQNQDASVFEHHRQYSFGKVHQR
jgi:hypothetical protein